MGNGRRWSRDVIPVWAGPNRIELRRHADALLEIANSRLRALPGIRQATRRSGARSRPLSPITILIRQVANQEIGSLFRAAE